MAMGLVLEFEGLGIDDYRAVNEKLGIDTADAKSDWPTGLLHHSAGQRDDGGAWVVLELWQSREAHDEFMHGRLGQAFQTVGLPPPSRVTMVALTVDTQIA